jgi:hypothetical protein
MIFDSGLAGSPDLFDLPNASPRFLPAQNDSLWHLRWWAQLPPRDTPRPAGLALEASLSLSYSL